MTTMDKMEEKTTDLLNRSRNSMDEAQDALEFGALGSVEYHKDQAKHYLLLAIAAQNEIIIGLLKGKL